MNAIAKESMQRKHLTRLIIVAAWLAILVIAYATLTKVGFVYAMYFRLAPYLRQPEMQTYAHFEHVIAFALLGALFTFAYPKRFLMVCCIVLGGAALLEIAQTLTPDRHGTLIDAVEKIVGGAVGIAFVRSIRHFRRDQKVSAD
jgi:VanZ family protein